MKRLLQLLAFILGTLLLAPAAPGKSKHASRSTKTMPATPVPVPTPLPDETAPPINPQAAPSASLQPFLVSHLGLILAPLDKAAFTQSSVIASMKTNYAGGLAASPDARKSAYQAAMDVCDAVAAAIDERKQALDRLHAPPPSPGPEARKPPRRAGTGSPVKNQEERWKTRAAELHEDIAGLYRRERAVEHRIGRWPPAAVPASPPLPGAVRDQ